MLDLVETDDQPLNETEDLPLFTVALEEEIVKFEMTTLPAGLELEAEHPYPAAVVMEAPVPDKAGELEERINELENGRADWMNEKQGLLQELERLQETIAQQDSERLTLQAHYNERCEEKAQLQSGLDLLEQQVREMHSERDQLETELAQMKQQLSEALDAPDSPSDHFSQLPEAPARSLRIYTKKLHTCLDRLPSCSTAT